MLHECLRWNYSEELPTAASPDHTALTRQWVALRERCLQIPCHSQTLRPGHSCRTRPATPSHLHILAHAGTPAPLHPHDTTDPPVTPV
ncbi:hypothetical protein E2C01_009349 [Portunus trituberculatus]|uniref:Uncharacterized protein n=1 Tax=Portunus trituberculatus TaxID=210409 RepID=A0A5B7D5R9_PORTR|nr:hypothetical protein [Portunus trituberculatus]